MADHPGTGVRLPLPVGLAPPWLTPEDEEHHWTRDLVHAPHQLTVLDFELWSRFIEGGARYSFQLYSLPYRYRARRFWTRYYSEYVEGAEPDPPVNQALDSAANAFGERWLGSWLPEVRASSDYLFGLDVLSATDEELATHLDEAIHHLSRAWELHFEMGHPVGRVWDWYLKLYAELFEGSEVTDAARLLLALPNMTTAAGHALWRLRDLAASLPAARAAFALADGESVLAALEAEPEAAPFLDGFREYLHDFCRRPPYVTLSEKTLEEDPAGVICLIKDALAHPERDPDQHSAVQSRERELAIEAARAALERSPKPVREEFDRLLALAQSAIQAKEDHAFYIDFQMSAAARRVPVEMGRRLAAAGALAKPEDFVHLTLEELRSALAARPPTDRRDLVEERQEEIARCRALEVPMEIGTKPTSEPAAGAATAHETEAQPGVLRGTAVSGGTGRGRARVVAGLSEARAMRPGEVLVAPNVSQPWTPLFATAAGLVTVTGGVLSHASIVAREYRLPAVARVTEALSRLRTGMLVEVDGSAGTVRILED